MRQYGRFTTDIWDDPKFRALSAAAQRVYLMLGTQADITAAGTLALRVRRWSRYASDTPSDALSDCLSELAEKRFVVIDEDTEELLVRSFAKWDGGINNPKRRPVVIDAAMSVESPTIRAVLAQELADLGFPDALPDRQADSLSDSQSADDRVVVTKRKYLPQPTTHNPQPLEPSAPTVPTRGARARRLDPEWVPDPADHHKMKFTDDQAAEHLAAFRDYWCSRGRDAARLDWQATWRNWLRNTDRRRAGTNGHKPSTTDARVTAGLELADMLERKAIT